MRKSQEEQPAREGAVFGEHDAGDSSTQQFLEQAIQGQVRVAATRHLAKGAAKSERTDPRNCALIYLAFFQLEMEFKVVYGCIQNLFSNRALNKNHCDHLLCFQISFYKEF